MSMCRKWSFVLISALGFLLAASIICQGSVYYVDSLSGSDNNAGLSASTPWRTISRVNKASLVPGDSVLFRRGRVWKETLVPPSGGASGNNIAFGAFGTGDLPTIDGSGRNYGISSNKDYITITDLHIKSASLYGIVHTKWDSSGHILSMPGWLIKNCRFTYCGVYLFGPNTIVQDNEFIGPAIRKADGAAIAFNGPISVNCSALRNTVSNFASRGIWFNGVAGKATVKENIIHDIAYTPGTTREGYGINFDGFASPIGGTVTAIANTVYNCARNGIKTENCSSGVIVQRNMIHDCKDSGIHLMNYPARPAQPPYPSYPDQRGKSIGGLVSYNIIYHCLYGMVFQNVSGIDVWNNTLYDGVGPYACGLKIDDSGSYYVKDVDFRNNIVGSGMTRACSTAKGWRNHLSAFDYNAIINKAIEVRSTSITYTLAQLNSSGFALNSTIANPAFVSPANHDYHLLATSPCINAGIAVGLTQDHEGRSIRGAPDLGAYESAVFASTTLPTVITIAPTAIQTTSAVSGGLVTDDGGEPVTERGLCWGLTSDPTTAASHSHDGSGTGSYVSNLTGLSPARTYHIRAYASNSSGTGYGKDLSFSTLGLEPAVLRPPLLLSPVNQSAGQPTTIKLTWRDRNISPPEQGYLIRIKGSGESYKYYTVGPDLGAYRISGLINGQAYRWNVRAVGDGRATADSRWANGAVDFTFQTALN